MSPASLVLDYPSGLPEHAAEYLRSKLAFYTDASDLAQDLAAGAAGLDRTITYVVYCDGIGCNGSTKGAYRLATLGFRVKELIGGLDWWRRDGYAVAEGEPAGTLASAAACAC